MGKEVQACSQALKQTALELCVSWSDWLKNKPSHSHSSSFTFTQSC